MAPDRREMAADRRGMTPDCRETAQRSAAGNDPNWRGMAPDRWAMKPENQNTPALATTDQRMTKTDIAMSWNA
eukprot:11195463-Lingulodinium_polyedra.AAC.1